MEHNSDQKLTILRERLENGILNEIKLATKSALLESIKTRIGQNDKKDRNQIPVVNTRTTLQAFESLGCMASLFNLVYESEEYDRNCMQISKWLAKESCSSSIESARKSWRKTIRYELNCFDEKLEKKSSYYNQEIEPSEDTYNVKETIDSLVSTKLSITLAEIEKLYDLVKASSFFLHMISRIRREDYKQSQLPLPSIGMIHIHMKSRTLLHYAKIFKELKPTNMHIGFDDHHEDSESFVRQWQQLGKDVITTGYISRARQYMKYGCPNSLRSIIWKLALGQIQEPRSKEEHKYFQNLVSSIHEQQANTVINSDLKNILFEVDMEDIRNNPVYFPFHNQLKKVFMCFGYDVWIAENSFPMDKNLNFSTESENKTEKPIFPSCILPFKGLVYFIAPISLIYEREIDMYFISRSLYSRFWTQLNTVSSMDDGMITNLCKTFEDLLMANHPLLFQHLLRLNVQPLSIAFPWIFSAFSQYLDVEEIFVLWDRIIAYNNLDLLPILAVSIVMFRSETLLTYAKNSSDVIDIFRDGSRIKVIPLLQTILFQHKL